MKRLYIQKYLGGVNSVSTDLITLPKKVVLHNPVSIVKPLAQAHTVVKSIKKFIPPLAKNDVEKTIFPELEPPDWIPDDPLPFIIEDKIYKGGKISKKKIHKIPLKEVVSLDYPELIEGKKRIKKVWQVRLKYLDDQAKIHTTHVKFGGKQVHPEKIKESNKSDPRCSQFWDVHWGMKDSDQRGLDYLIIRKKLGLCV